MPAVEQNIELEKGADYEVVGWVEDDFGNAVDISGDKFRAQVRELCGGALIADFVFVVFLDTTVTPNVYKYRRTMTQAVINAIPQTEGVWDQFWESAAGKSTRMFFGDAEIKCNVTTPTV